MEAEAYVNWQEKAEENIKKWGLQSVPTLLLATQEELSETMDEVYDEVDGHTKLDEELYSSMARGFAVQSTHERLFEDDRGNPIDDPPTLEMDADGVDLDELEAELADTAALLVQLQMAIDEEREE